MAVPNTFATATTAIPLSQLDTNFATPITLGNTAIQLGNTVTTLNNMTLANVTVSSGTASVSNLSASGTVTFSGTGAVQMTSGTTGQQPSPATAGMLRFNTTTTQFEGYNGTAWASVGGAAISNDTSTSTSVYPLFAAATSGTALTVYTSNAKLLYKPSTGEFSATVPRASNAIFVNSQTVASDYTIAATDNGLSAGPVSVNSGITVTVSSGAVWTVV